MILVDTSIWIDHLRRDDLLLVDLLTHRQVLGHPLTLSEMVIGHLKDRHLVVENLSNLQQAVLARHEEVVDFIEDRRLFGTGLSYIDARLLASVTLTPGASIWTRDKRMRSAAKAMSIDTPILH